MHELRHYEILLAIETDTRRDHGEHPGRPGLLDDAAADRLLTHLAAELATMLPRTARSTLAMPGALYDQSQILRPGYPVYRALQALSASHEKARRIALGATDGLMPDGDLQPSGRVQPPVLLVLPVLVSASPTDADSTFDEMETIFIERGRVSAHTARGLEAGFGIGVRHARFMTLAELMAMLYMQLNHFGFPALWQLLDAALGCEARELSVTGRGGQEFHWDGKAVRCRFETFDFWSRNGAGRQLAAESNKLAREYAAWTREYRQHLVTLKAHCVPVVQHLPGEPQRPLTGSFFAEESPRPALPQATSITEHSFGDLGTIAITVLTGEAQINYYPLLPEGLNDLHAHIRSSGQLSGGVAYPGSIHYDPATRRLVPDRLPPGA